MNEPDFEKLAEYYDTTDLSDEIEETERDDTVTADPMITTSLRLPKSVLDDVRARAEAEGVKPTALIRRWVEQALTNAVPTQMDRGTLREIVHEELEPFRQFLADQKRPAR